MSKVALRQLDLILDLTGGKIAPRAMIPVDRPNAVARLCQLGASVLGFLGSFIWPVMAIVGDNLAWGSGSVTLVSKLGLRAFAREILHGRPVIFIRRRGDHPYSRLMDALKFDREGAAQSLFNGNSCLTLSGVQAGERVFAHVGKGDDGRSSVHRHVTGLSVARAALMETSLLRAIARPVFAQDHGEISVFTESHLEGRKMKLAAVSGNDFPAALLRAGAPLFEIHQVTVKPDVFPERSFLERMKADLARASPDARITSGIGQIIGDVENWLEKRKPGATRAHGDYTISNLLFDNTGEVSAVTDWEWTRADGCAGYDLTYLGISAGAERFGLDFATLAANLVRSADVPPPVEKYFQATLPRINLDPDDIAPLAKLAWLGTIFRSSVWTPPPSPDWIAGAARPMIDTLTASR